MDRTVLTLSFLLAAVQLPGQDLSRMAYNRYVGSSTYTFPATEPGQLVMENVRGDIVITGVSTGDVEITETVSVRASSEEKAARLYDEVKASVKQVSGEGEALAVVIAGKSSRGWHASLDYSIRVPTLFSLKVNSRGGDVEVDKVKGQIDLITGGGDMDLSHLTGRVTASTSGGDMDGYELSGRVFLNTAGGDIDVESVQGDLTVRTSGGDIRVENVHGGVSVTTAGGDIDLMDIEGREIVGRTGGGDIAAAGITGRVDLSTSGGNISTENISGDLDASTSGGDIEMENTMGDAQVWTSAGAIVGKEMLGAVNAQTSAGDIVIIKVWDSGLDEHDIDLKTSAGDIELTLPGNFSARFWARVLSPYEKPGESIVTDFPLTITASEAIARAKGTLNDGVYSVRLESAVGTITIFREE
ncbi:MAG: DUF4097 domain-containing protein [Fidelibacterota bacterium]